MTTVHFEPEPNIRDFIEFRRRQCMDELRELVPGAELEHVGSTAIPAGWTNGEVDIQVRVPTDKLAEAEKAIGERYEREKGGLEGFAVFHHEGRGVRIHLTSVDDGLDRLKRQRDLLREQALLRERYDAIKRRHQNGELADYSAEKEKFWKDNGATQ